MTLVLFGMGVLLILAALWNRDEERMALVLFFIGAVLVLIGGALYLPHFFAPGG